MHTLRCSRAPRRSADIGRVDLLSVRNEFLTDGDDVGLGRQARDPDALTRVLEDGDWIEGHHIVLDRPHAEHAVSAFELDAADYLTKPVRLERLQQALAKVQRLREMATRTPPAAESLGEVLLIQDRGRTERVPLTEVLLCKAELKYVTLRTASRSYVLDSTLAELEARHGAQLMRVHRNALVARHAVRALEKHFDAEEGDCWAVRLAGLAEPIMVSRRQVAAVREEIAHG